MNGLRIRTALAGAAALIAAAAAAWGGAAGAKLYYNGKVASGDVIVKDGVAYVPIRDVAAALAMTVQTRDDGYALVRPGGGTQIEGLNGKIGDDLFNGSFRFKVVEVVRGDHYTRRFSHGDDVIAPNGEEIVAVVIRVKNGTPKTQGVMVFGEPTALTDEDEHGYEPSTGGWADGPGRNVDVLPGAAIDLALTFHVPRSAKLKDLLYTPSALPGKPGPAFRVSLKPPAASP